MTSDEILDKVREMLDKRDAKAHAPCPSCGHCPTCGHTPMRAVPMYPYPWVSPYPYWWGTQTVAPAWTLTSTSGTANTVDSWVQMIGNTTEPKHFSLTYQTEPRTSQITYGS